MPTIVEEPTTIIFTEILAGPEQDACSELMNGGCGHYRRQAKKSTVSVTA